MSRPLWVQLEECVERQKEGVSILSDRRLMFDCARQMKNWFEHNAELRAKLKDINDVSKCP